MILSHHTEISMSRCVVEDGVYKQIYYNLVTRDISMSREQDPIFRTPLTLDLPPPDPDNFIPFNKVDERVILKWIADLEPNLIHKQTVNTDMLTRKILNGYFD